MNKLGGIDMKKYSRYFQALFIALILTFTLGSINQVNARQGCGYGRHMCYRTGYCVPNGTVCQQRWYHGGRYIPATGRYIYR